MWPAHCPHPTGACRPVLCYPTHNWSSLAPKWDPEVMWPGSAGLTDPKREGMMKAAVIGRRKLNLQGSKKRRGGGPRHTTVSQASTLSQRAHCIPNKIRSAGQGREGMQDRSAILTANPEADKAGPPWLREGTGPYLKPSHQGQQSYSTWDVFKRKKFLLNTKVTYSCNQASGAGHKLGKVSRCSRRVLSPGRH